MCDRFRGVILKKKIAPIPNRIFFIILYFFSLDYLEGNCCPKYEAGLGRVIEDFGNPCPGCPFVYQSDSFVESKTS